MIGIDFISYCHPLPAQYFGCPPISTPVTVGYKRY